VALSLLWVDGANLRWNLWRTAPTLLAALLTIGLFATSRLTVWTALAAGFVGACTLWALLAQKTFAWRPLRVSLKPLRAQLSYGVRVAIGSTADTVSARLDQALMVAMVPSADLGLYAVAVTASGLSGPMMSSLNLTLFPELRRERSAEAQRKLTSRAFTTVLVGSTGVAALLALIGPWLLALLFGNGFADAATPLRLLLLGQVANDATGPLMAQLLAAGRPGATSQASAAAAAVTVAGLVLFVPKFGINGAAVTTTVSYLIRCGYCVVAVQRNTSRAPVALLKDGPSLEGSQ
jgi:O-antigen/teichoic acid export membrane protein